MAKYGVDIHHKAGTATAIWKQPAPQHPAHADSSIVTFDCQSDPQNNERLASHSYQLIITYV